MSIYGIGNTAAYCSKANTAKAENVTKQEKTETKKETYQKANADTIEAVKAEVERQTESMRSLVEKLIRQQGQTIGNADSMWSFLASGNYKVDPETKKAAQAAIAEDGYWGVEQTSQRIVDFAKNLTGGDPDKIEAMRTAIDKGFQAATKAWGSTLPDISSKTYDAIMKKLDDWAQEGQSEAS